MTEKEYYDQVDAEYSYVNELLNQIDSAYNDGYADGYKQAVDEFAEKIKFHLNGIRLNYVDAFGSTVAYMVIEDSEKMIDAIAEGLKAVRGSE